MECRSASSSRSETNGPGSGAREIVVSEAVPTDVLHRACDGGYRRASPRISRLVGDGLMEGLVASARRDTRSGRGTQTLWDAIVTLRLAPGTRLVLRELVDRLGISRTGVRAAPEPEIACLFVARATDEEVVALEAAVARADASARGVGRSRVCRGFPRLLRRVARRRPQ